MTSSKFLAGVKKRAMFPQVTESLLKFISELIFKNYYSYVKKLSSMYLEKIFMLDSLTSCLALQKLCAILAKYITTAGRLIGETRLLKWYCEQKEKKDVTGFFLFSGQS